MGDYGALAWRFNMAALQEINPKPSRETLPASSFQSTSKNCRAFSPEIRNVRGSRLRVLDDAGGESRRDGWSALADRDRGDIRRRLVRRRIRGPPQAIAGPWNAVGF